MSSGRISVFEEEDNWFLRLGLKLNISDTHREAAPYLDEGNITSTYVCKYFCNFIDKIDRNGTS